MYHGITNLVCHGISKAVKKRCSKIHVYLYSLNPGDVTSKMNARVWAKCSETHEIVLLGCTTGEAGLHDRRSRECKPVTPVECVSRSFCTYPGVLAFIILIVCINGIKIDSCLVNLNFLSHIFQLPHFALMNRGETCHLKRRVTCGGRCWAGFLSLARSKLRLCSTNHRSGYWSNLPCDWPSTAWAYSEQELLSCIHTSVYAATIVRAHNAIMTSRGRILIVTSHNVWMGYEYSLP